MPYQWTETRNAHAELRLWPHQSLPPQGLAAFVLATFTMISLPLYGLLGTALLWGLLPFLLIAVFGVWYALRRSQQDRSIFERLVIDVDVVRLTRQNPRSSEQHWECNAYWARPELHPTGGPVPNYVTLSGNGRHVEVGAFLSEEERIALYGDLVVHISDAVSAHRQAAEDRQGPQTPDEQ